MRSRNCALLSILLVSVFSTTLYGQEFTGHVKDASGAAVSGATVTVHNELTNQDIKTKTTAAGDYAVPYLKAGQYSVTAEMQGFEKQARAKISLEADSTLAVDFMLKVG